jgi:molybdopterin converting factor small subunit
MSKMSVKIKIPKYLQSKTNGEVIAEVEGSTLGKSIEALIRQYPDLKGEILDSKGIVLLKWMIYINNKNVPSPDKLSDPVKDGDIIALFPLIAGG